MPLNPFSFTPPQGFRDVTFAPTDPPNETAFRDTMQGIPDQLRDELNSLYTKLNSITDGSSGADTISATPLTGGTANTVQGILEELKTEIDLDDGNNVKLTGNQTINGEKTFVVSPQVPTPDSVNDASNKGYVDTSIGAVVLGQIPDGSLTDVKLSDTAGQIKDKVSVLQSDVDTLETEMSYNNKAIAEMQMFLELESKIPSKDNNKFYTDFINSFIASAGVIDSTSQNYTGALSSGATSVTVPSATGFVKGQEISVQDAVGYEDVVILSVVGNVITFKTALVNTYTNPRIYRSNNSTTGFGTAGITTTTYDRTTPVQVVNSAYDTNGSARPQVLSNGWIVTTEYHVNVVYFQVSKDGGATFQALCTVASTYITNSKFSIQSSGTTIYYLGVRVNGVSFGYFDATTISGTHTPQSANLDSSITSSDSCSIAIDTNGHLHAAWSSKNATYPNSFNIRYSKSTDGGVTWEIPTQKTATNTTGSNNTTPTIVCVGATPIIIYSYSSPSSNVIRSGSIIYSDAVYSQSSPSATVDSNGVIHVAWHGYDATDTTQNNIRYSKSADNGATWSAMEKLTSGNTITGYLNPSITTDLNNVPHVMFEKVTSGQPNQIMHIKYGSATVQITSEATSQIGVSLCDNYKNFEKPLSIWKNNGGSVKLYGKWSIQIDAPTTKSVIRINITPYINCNELQTWITKSELAGFTVDGKASFKVLSTDDEVYIDLVETVTDLGSTNEVSMTGVSTIASKYITLKLILQRASTSDVVTFTKLVGGVA